jgi:hypothetical protein
MWGLSFYWMLEKHMHHHIIRLKEGCVWAQTNCLTVPLVIDVPIPSPKNEWSCIYVLGVSICWFDVVLAVSYFLFFILFQTYPCLQYSLVISNKFNTREWNLLWQWYTLYNKDYLPTQVLGSRPNHEKEKFSISHMN